MFNFIITQQTIISYNNMFMALQQELMRYSKKCIRLRRFVIDLNLRAFFLQSGFHSARKYFVGCQENDAINSPIQRGCL